MRPPRNASSRPSKGWSRISPSWPRSRRSPGEEFSGDRTQNYAVKRALQNVVNAAIDCTEMILVAEGISGESMPETNREKIDRLVAETGIGETVHTELGQSAGFRNLLAHQYGSDIEDEIVYDVLQNKLGVFQNFASDIRDTIGEE